MQTTTALAMAPAPKSEVKPLAGKCQGGLRPSGKCTTREHCSSRGREVKKIPPPR